MKNLIFLILSIFITTFSFGQIKTINSTYSIVEKTDFTTEYKNRSITITPQAITITKLLNGGKESEICEIDKTIEKDYFDKSSTWYYCTSTVKDFINGYSKIIVIVSKTNDRIDLFTFADEVSIYHQSFHR